MKKKLFNYFFPLFLYCLIADIFLSGNLIYRLPILTNNIKYAENFNTEKNYFRKKFIEFARNDQVIDKNELEQLKKIAENSSPQEREFANQVLSKLSEFKDRITLTYTLKGERDNEDIELEFSLTPTYSEDDKIEGKNAMEIVSNISQKDTLSETKADDLRCGSASLINAYILMGGSFSKLAAKIGINKEFTYKNIHLLQEKIYNMANSDGAPGIESGYKYTINQETGNISNIRGSGEIMIAAAKIGLTVKPILGSNVKTIYQRKKEIERFFKENPDGVLQVGVHLDVNSGEISSPIDENDQDHSVIVFKMKDGNYMADSSGINNGNRENVKKFTNSGLNSIVYNSRTIINGLTLLH